MKLNTWYVARWAFLSAYDDSIFLMELGEADSTTLHERYGLLDLSDPDNAQEVMDYFRVGMTAGQTAGGYKFRIIKEAGALLMEVADKDGYVHDTYRLHEVTSWIYDGIRDRREIKER